MAGPQRRHSPGVTMQRYQLGGRIIAATDAEFPELLAQAYALREKPLCLCQDGAALALHISRRGGTPAVSRWPGTGAHHAPDCDHYAAPDLLTGLGQVRGSAVLEDEATGAAALRLAFPLTRAPARSAPTALTNDKPAVKSNGQRLSMRGLLHFLWDRAELTYWHPGMAGRRNWFIVRRALREAARTCRVRGDSLSGALFIPEIFKVDRKDEILSRRQATLAPVYASRDAMMIVIGEIKSITEARYGERIILKHLPDWPITMDKDMARRFHQRVAAEQGLWNAGGADGHLVMAASFAIAPSGVPELIELSLMPVTAQWLPFESLAEQALLAKAVDEGRRFVKGLRFNLGSQVPIASLTLTDTGALATAVYLERFQSDMDYDRALETLRQVPGIAHATWAPARNLPARSRHLPGQPPS